MLQVHCYERLYMVNLPCKRKCLNMHTSSSAGLNGTLLSPVLQVDIYSFGVVLWEIVTQDRGRRGQLRQTKVPDECPAGIEELIDQ